jgi:GNAT superfamily N-acetyltransferase
VSRIAIRPAVRDDLPLIFSLIVVIAAYEELSHAVDATPAMIEAALFGDAPAAHCDIAALDGVDVGFALWFFNFSTFRGKRGIYLEDLFVRPQARGAGVGKALLANLAKRCVAMGLVRLEWSVLDWNQTAIDFYKAHGAELMDGWTTCRVSDQGLWRLAEAFPGREA